MKQSSYSYGGRGHVVESLFHAVPDEIPFDVPYGLPISLDRAEAVTHAAMAEAKKRNWKMNLAVADSEVTWLPSSEWTARCLRRFRSRSQGPELPRPSGAQQRSLKMASVLCTSNTCSRSDGVIAPGRHSPNRAGQDYRSN